MMKSAICAACWGRDKAREKLNGYIVSSLNLTNHYPASRISHPASRITSMTFPGLSDSIASVLADPRPCPHCDSSSHIAGGLCVGCLLEAGLDPAGACESEALTSVLAEINLPDQNWRLGNYEILEEIGRGGMGVIYRARQRHSRRIVAVKRVLSYHSDSRETLARFRREAQAAASLDHPNVLPIYEVSESEDGLPFFSMKFAPGGTLQQVAPALRTEPRQCVAFVAKIARAVQYAHSRGILHRDLKPGNILLDGRGEPLVSDFGLAKWLDTTSDLTRTLTIFGTPGYIAPEQASSAAAELKPTADVYSLGAILFDLLAGRPPFLGTHALSVIRQAAENPAPKLRSLSKVADRDLETICSRCLERDPSARYRSAHELAEDLERWLEGRPIIARPISPAVRLWRCCKRNPLVAGSLAATIIVGGLALARQIETRALARTVHENQWAAHSIAILPFLDLETAQTDISFAKSLATALRAEMANLGTARVIAVTDGVAAVPGAGNLADLRMIGGETGCRTTLAGTLRWVGEKRRVSLRLSDVQTGDTLFEWMSEANPSKSPAPEVAASIARSLFAAIARSARTISSSVDPGMSDPAANEFLRAGDDLMTHRTPADLDRALTCYQRAIDLQPKSAIARTAFVMATVRRTQLGPGNPELSQKAARFGREAVALNPLIAPTHRALGGLLFFVQGDILGAREEALRTIELGALSDGPNLLGMVDKTRGRPDLALRWYRIGSHWRIRPADDESVLGDCWADLGEDNRAEKMYQRIAELHPELPEGWMGLCRLRLLASDFASARKIYQENEQRYSQFSYTAQIAAEVEFFSRNYAEAEKLYGKLEQTDPGGGGPFYGAVSYQSVLGWLHSVSGDQALARSILTGALDREKEALRNAPQNPEILYRLAAIESGLGELDPALKYLRAAAANGWLDYRSLALDPRFDSLRQDVRYSAISGEMATHVASLQRLAVNDNK
jgi:tetratricopeptide (TPR) repeat protein/tRNA A-37 threonylcarbamoyl transferase component Bud32